MGQKRVGKDTKKRERSVEGLGKYVAAFDMHVGFERAHTKGKLITKPVHNMPAIHAMLDFCRDFMPDTFLFGGDQLNCGPVSHWNRGRPQLIEGFKLKDELDLFHDVVLDPIIMLGCERLVWLEGNHEVWLRDFVEENPALQGMLGINEYLGLEDCGFELYSQGELAKIGKCYFMHGDTLGSHRGVAQRTVGKYRRNIRFGHYHHLDAATLTNPLDVVDSHTAIAIPSLCHRGPSYQKNAPNNWINGFVWGYYDKVTGDFWDNIVVMVDDSFVANGKLYKGSEF